MKTNFALGVTEDGVTLWQRGERDWLRVGAVALDHPQMTAAVGDLVARARKLVSGQIVTQIVIPDDQILYTRVTAPGPDTDAQRAQIRKALEGRTPFPVEELNFDWTGAGAEVDVAVVARETLIEAEDFAREHHLNPVCFVAAPGGGAFKHAPFFGTTRIVRDILGSADDLTRDRVILRETGTVPEAKAPEPDMAPPAAKGDGAAKSAQAATPVKTPPPAAKHDPAAESSPATSPAAAADTPKAESAPEATADAAPADKQESPAAAPKTPKTPDNDAPATPAGSAPKDAKPDAGKTPAAGVATPGPGAPGPATPPRNPQDSAQIGFRSRRQQDAQATGSAAPVSGAVSGTSLTAQTDKLAKAADTDKRADAKAGAAGLGKQLRSGYAKANARIASSMGLLRARLQEGSKKPQPAKPAAEPIKQSAPAKKTDQPAPVSTDTKSAAIKGPDLKNTGAKSGAQPWQSPPAAKTAIAATPPKPASSVPASSETKSSPETKPTEKAAPAEQPKAPGTDTTARKSPLETLRSIGQTAPGQPAATDAEAQRLTVFGARGQAVDSRSGVKPVMLIGAGLLAILAAGTIWAFYFDNAAPPDIPVTLAPAPEAATDAPGMLDAATDTPEDDAIEAALGLEDAAERGPGMDTAAETAPPATLEGESVSPTEDASAPGLETRQGRVAGLRSSALIMPQEMVELPSSPAAPEPFGAQPLPPLRSELAAQDAEAATQDADDTAVLDDAAAIAAAIAEASALPDGEEALEIEVTQGRPATAPPEKPLRFTLPATPTPEPEPAETTPPQDAPANADDAQLPGDSAQATGLPDESDLDITVTPGTPPVVPPSRPGDPPQTESDQSQVPADEGDIQQASVTATPGGLVLSALRPASRPSDLAARVEALQESAAPQIANATPQAVAASRRPTDRPSQFASTVQRALSAATPTPPAATSTPQTPVQTASAAAAAMPNIPTSASVAREATQARAINLRQVNLIGVMGTSSNRRALVRLSNGRVVTVRVGESLDGGQVTAIGETELRYNRRGRDVVLRIAS
ncbi:hypothetical protein [Roseinatronobacter alkalisoli]|uniref:Uncharacterized protein n=1 Tax=Roseinatronobacter alkalisoli TaxID=3028235 RepID=A0ABT5T5Y5_9RHOB|nr:hypothetical protein [Roseinatronobacter sp. HJB301]MDD7970449.1 hypothetical protein [Roseinatronobacter sp. HJB301]